MVSDDNPTAKRRALIWISVFDLAAWITALYGLIFAGPVKKTNAVYPLIAGNYMLIMYAFSIRKMKRTADDEFVRLMTGIAWLALGLVVVFGYNHASIFIVVPIFVIFIFGIIWSAFRAARKEKSNSDGSSQTHHNS